MQQGRILKGIGGFYYVLPEDSSETVECKARGRFRMDGLTPMVGDRVLFETQREGHARIAELLPRKNALMRPPVANIDQLLIVLYASVPAPDWLLADKLIVQAKLLSIEPVLVLNKCDESGTAVLSAFERDYAAHFRCLRVSARRGDGLLALTDLLRGRVSCFAGQSAVGKSSLINAICPELSLETGGLSKKTARGRHTTRHAELWPAFGGAILDTPGFSLFEPDFLEQDALDRCYPEFMDLPAQCRFFGCMHISEPDCAVKERIAAGGMSPARYERYTLLAREFETRRKHRYD